MLDRGLRSTDNAGGTRTVTDGSALPTGTLPTLRPATRGDRAFVERLYFDTMQPLLSALNEWDQTTARRRFHNGYHQKDACIIMDGSAPLGWMQVTETPKALVLNQIHLVPEVRGHGIGSRLIQDLMARATAGGRGVTLAVVRNNPALKLYERLGFSVVGEDGSRLRMAWPATSVPLSRSIPASAP